MGKRTFSSSPKATISTQKASRSPAARSASTTPMPATTPRFPSNAPASFTVSICEPMMRAGKPGRVPS